MATTIINTTKTNLFGDEKRGEPFVLGHTRLVVVDASVKYDRRGVVETTKANDNGTCLEEGAERYSYRQFVDIQSIALYNNAKHVYVISVLFSDGTRRASHRSDSEGGGCVGVVMERDDTSGNEKEKMTKSEINLAENEYVNEIVVRFSGDVVACLTFRTNRGRALGPCGDPSGSFFQRGTQHVVVAPVGMKLVEITGRCGGSGRRDVHDCGRISAIGFRWGPIAARASPAGQAILGGVGCAYGNSDDSNDYGMNDGRHDRATPLASPVNDRGCVEAKVALVEIVSAWDLSPVDPAAAGAYVKVVRVRSSSLDSGDGRGDGSEGNNSVDVLHKTDPIPKTTAPIWTVRNGSLFLLRSAGEERDGELAIGGLARKEGAVIRFEVWDSDGGGLLRDKTSTLFGTVDVPLSDIWKGTGKRLEYSLVRPRMHASSRDADTLGDSFEVHGEDYGENKGKLALRFRPASKENIRFVEAMRDLESLYSMTGAAGEFSYGREDDGLSLPPGSQINVTGFELPTFGSPSSSLAPAGFLRSFTKQRKKVDRVTGETKFRTRPGPDPERVSSTEWMTREEIEKETYEPSKCWIDAGSGFSSLGTIELEILACDGLPNMDNPVTGRTDAFICVVYEDVVICTDVVENSLSPRWMPWTKRAISLRRMHPSSRIYLAALDYDELGPSDNHDFIGRVAVDVTNFVCGTEYTLKYALYTSCKVGERGEPRGSITIRLSVEPPKCRQESSYDNGKISVATSCDDFDRQLCLTSLSPPPTFFVNATRRKEFRAARYAVSGNVDVDQFALRTMTSYVAEIMTYRDIAFHLQEALWTVLLWKGHYRVNICVPRCFFSCRRSKTRRRGEYMSTQTEEFDEDNDHDHDHDHEDKRKGRKKKKDVDCCRCQCLTRKGTVSLPLHSMVAFASAVILVEYPRFLPSFFAGSLAWILLAVLGRRRNDPSPWRHCCRTYVELASVFLFRGSPSLSFRGRICRPPPAPRPLVIDPFENEEAIRRHDEEWNRRMETIKQRATERARLRQKQLEEERDKVGEIDVNVATRDYYAALISPLEPFLHPLQDILGNACQSLQIARSVILWDECYYAFWITTVSIACAVVFAFIPWGFMLLWIARILVWTFLGPWMKLVDIFYIRRNRRRWQLHRRHQGSIGRTEQKEEVQEEEEESHRRRLEELELLADTARQTREHAIKLRDVRSFLFGSYATRVPRFKIDRHRDVPLPASSAKAKPIGRQNGDLCQRVAETTVATRTRTVTRVLGQHLVGDMIPERKRKTPTEEYCSDGNVGAITRGDELLDGDDDIEHNDNEERMPLTGGDVGTRMRKRK